MDTTAIFTLAGLFFVAANLVRLLDWVDQPHSARAR